ncbi:DUF6994 family protein [Aeromicrobium duanguangcaii]|uniref:DUF6994 family protein n=1 Tax=Aeromicrobium duanguangcaii TaxID=2968086 RepID=UPI002016B18F|nr:hypothetical protein [Aeromicrobium duanguangcaii]MCL3838320.1 hypothetical protein [Aeromicrobium duanguangcaii]
MTIDTDFDVRLDARGKDPDSFSPTLRQYHQRLWSKQLPDGTTFELHTDTPDVYLHHRSDKGDFWLSSDSIIPTFTTQAAMQPIIGCADPASIESFVHLAYTVGGFIIWPAQRVDGKQTLNGARGFHPRIKDRMDLTLECIRRHYCGLPSPLGETLNRYTDFFELFNGFAGYVEFFLLQDLLTPDDGVDFFLPFEDFRGPAVPRDLDGYMAYRERTIAFIAHRNERMLSSQGQ